MKSVTKKKARKATTMVTPKATKPGELWELFDSLTQPHPTGYLIAESGNINLPLAFVRVRKSTDPAEQYRAMASAMELAIAIRDGTKRISDQPGDVLDLTTCARPDSPYEVPDAVNELFAGKIGDEEREIFEPYCRFKFARALKRYVVATFDAEHLQTYFKCCVQMCDSDGTGGDAEYVPLP